MKIVKFEEAEKFSSGTECEILEYPLNDKDINCAVANINGRYPKEDYARNEVCKELIYVLDGIGELIYPDKTIAFSKGDVLLINPGEKYYWQGNFSIVMPCTPSWYPEQHKIVK